MPIDEFVAAGNHSLKVHPIKWEETSRPDGFTCLNEQMQECTALQFSITAHEHGRVLGLILGGVFYVVWLDPNHSLYPMK
jgi:hypothetical protein